jgi:glycosyltransferase involved in cell wall biosynthesis
MVGGVKSANREPAGFLAAKRSSPDLRRAAAATAERSGQIPLATLADTPLSADPPAAPQRCLHVFPSFEVGGVALRMVRTINHFGERFRHTIIALNNNFEAAGQFARNVEVRLLRPRRVNQGPFGGVFAGALALRRLQPDLLLTYNWGAIEWAIANRLLPVARHVHLESGFRNEEADTQIRRRVLCRRWALAGCARIVVPSRRLEDLAQRVWKLPAQLVTYLPNGVDVERFAAPTGDAIPGFTRRPGERIVGTVAPLRPEKNVGRLLRVFAMLGDRPAARLIVAGDGVERGALEALAAELGIADRVLFTGQVQPESVLGTFDVFALSSETEQMPNALLEAMASSRAVAAVDVGDVKAMVSEENRDFIVPRDDPAAFAGALGRLLREDATRARLGRSNRARAVAEFSQERMFAGYADVFGADRAY